MQDLRKQERMLQKEPLKGILGLKLPPINSQTKNSKHMGSRRKCLLSSNTLLIKQLSWKKLHLKSRLHLKGSIYLASNNCFKLYIMLFGCLLLDKYHLLFWISLHIKMYHLDHNHCYSKLHLHSSFQVHIDFRKCRLIQLSS